MNAYCLIFKWLVVPVCVFCFLGHVISTDPVFLGVIDGLLFGCLMPVVGFVLYGIVSMIYALVITFYIEDGF